MMEKPGVPTRIPGEKGFAASPAVPRVTWLAVLLMATASATLFSRKRHVSSKPGDESCIITSSVVL